MSVAERPPTDIKAEGSSLANSCHAGGAGAGAGGGFWHPKREAVTTTPTKRAKVFMGKGFRGRPSTDRRSWVDQRGSDLNTGRRGRRRARRVRDRDADIEGLAEKRLVVDPFVVELVANAIELAVPPFVRGGSER